MNKNPQIFAVIGDPVAHSKSPDMFNAAFKALGLNAHYKAIQVKTSELESFFKRMRDGEISGVNVTIPHKQTALKFCDDVSDFAKKVGAVNTIVVKNKKLVGDNTDGPGYIQSLVGLPGLKLKSSHVIVLGSGGASRAICAALNEKNIASLTVVNRKIPNADQLADCDLLINTTPLGMVGQNWPNLSFLKDLKKTAIVSDIVYNPKDTELLKAAKKLEHPIHYGYTMLLHQALLAFKIFTGKTAPQEIMEQALSLFAPKPTSKLLVLPS